jgi:hypothetical protein
MKQCTCVGVLVVIFWSIVIPAVAHAQDDTGWLLEQTNALRASLGVHGYVVNAQLSAAAYQHSEYMATTCDISHTEANGSTPASRAAANGYGGSHVSENIYGGRNATAADAWNFWLNSPIHYNGLVHGRNNEIGFGVAHGPCGHYYTMDIGYRADVNAPPAPPAAADSAAADVPAAPAPTRKPYVPPQPTRTPTATIPTLTPSATWTITPTYTPSPTGTTAPPTGTPLVLPTVPAPGQGTAVALVSSPIVILTATPEQVPAAAKILSKDEGFELRDLIPFALVGQFVLIGLAGFVYFRRSQ